jgi:hypothetical protein
VAIVMLTPGRHPRFIGTSLTFALLCLTLGVIAGCGGAKAASKSASPSPAATTASPHASPSGLDSFATRWQVRVVRSAIRSAYRQGRAGGRQVDPSITAALRTSIASDPSVLNGASRAVLLLVSPWEAEGYRPTATQTAVLIYVWAEGDQMIAAGTLAPGFSSTSVTLSRSSPSAAWQIIAVGGVP